MPASLRVVTEPPEARVYINGQFVGQGHVLEAQPAELRVGESFMTVQSPGYFPHDLRLELVPGVTKVEVRLRPVPL
ncbi:MAG: PEGA domain-containing protein [Myxococcota bacterium]